MSGVYDVAIIGGGHNGLVCAGYLAKAGKRVVLAEASDRFGGAAITREFAPGMPVSACAHLIDMLPRSVVSDLGLTRHGLSLGGGQATTTVLCREGQHIRLTPDGAVGASVADGAAYRALAARLRRFAGHLRPVMDMEPPRLGTSSWSDHARLLRLGWQLRSLGRADMRELLRIIGMNVYDLAEEHFESPLLRAALAFDAVLGHNYGPRTPGTVLTLLYRLAAQSGAVALSAGSSHAGMVTQAMAAAARGFGAELRCAAPVARILVEHDKAAGLCLADGQVLKAHKVISSADPKTTFLRLLGPEYLDTGFVRKIRHFRSQGATAKLHLALSEQPDFAGVDSSALAGRLVIAPSPDYIETAFNPTNYGAFPESPALEILCPTARGQGQALRDKHVLSVIVQYAPYTLREGWENRREAFMDCIVNTIEPYAPGLREKILARELLTPLDIEREFGMAGGHWHHGELAFDQILMMRPVPGAAHYASPVDGLYLCGAGAHPGGGVMGLAGRNAARAVVRSMSAGQG